jgi:hypothetical protein
MVLTFAFMFSPFLLLSQDDNPSSPPLLIEMDQEEEMLVVTEGMIRKKILELRADAAAGPDRIHPKLLKTLGDSILTPLQILYRKSLLEGKVPNEWTKAIVTPILKKGSKREPGNSDQYH